MFSSFLGGSQQSQYQPASQEEYPAENDKQDYYDEKYVEKADQDQENEEDMEEEEVPLLEDLDIDIEMVKNNLKSVILFKKFEHRFTEDPDMTGPLLVGFSLALALILVNFPIFFNLVCV